MDSLRSSPSAIKSNLTFFLLAALLALVLGSLAVLLNGTGVSSSLIILGCLALVLIIGIALLLFWRPIYSLYVFLLFWPIYPFISKATADYSYSIFLRLWQEILLVWFFAAVIVYWSHRPSYQIHIYPIDWVVLLFLSTGLYSALLARNFDLILYGFHLSYTPVLMYFLARFLGLDFHHANRWIKIFLVVALGIALLGIYIHFTDPLSWYLKMVPVESLPAFFRSGKWRMASILGNPLYFGVFVALGATFSLSLFFQTWQNKKLSIFWLLCTGVFVACTWWSISRAAWGMLLVSFTLIIWGEFSKKPLGRTWLLFLVVFAIVGLITLLRLYSSEIRTLLSDSFGNFLLASRFSQWGPTWQQIKSAPWGYGLGVGHAQRRVADISTNVEIYDGWYLKVLAESGLYGLLTVITLIVVTTRYFIRQMKVRRTGMDNNPINSLNLAMLATLLGYFVAAIGSNVWDYYMVPSVVWLLFGLIITINQGPWLVRIEAHTEKIKT